MPEVIYPLASTTWDSEEVEAATRLLKNNQLTMGAEVRKFEEDFARYIGSKYAVMFNSGSSANLGMLAALRYVRNSPVEEGDEVIVPTVSWSTTYYPVNQVGLTLKFVDINLQTLNIDVDLVKQAIDKKASLFSMDMIPRTTRAQSMDVLSSQANIAGYRAVLLAATMFPKYFPMFMTAAGSIPPAKMVIIGAGVAGLQAIATAKRLGAVVEVSDTRPQVKEEVMSLGGKFIEVEGAADASKAGGYAVEQSEEFKQRQQQRLAESIAKADIIITTAQIPGKKAPVLITDVMLKSMKPGSVVIDLAAATGGNTAVTKNNETIVYEGVTILGNSNLASDMPSDASKLYGKNILNFLQLIITKEGALELNFEDDLVKGCCMAHEGAVANERVAALIN
jgi:NAD(P) transhydrogenase subunit alpha